MSRVPDDDLHRLVNDPIETALIDGASVESMARELLALRARQAQDTPSDPAAWLYALPEFPDDYGVTVDPRAAVGFRRAGYVVTDLVRAPGAVAVAPTEDEDAAARAVYAAMYDVPVEDWDTEGESVHEKCRAVAAVALAVPPAPSAGEDEAAVERAARAYHEHTRYDGREWDSLFVEEQIAIYTPMRAALAAARGPRTRDDT